MVLSACLWTNSQYASSSADAAAAGAARDGMVHSLRGFRWRLQIVCESQEIK
jgi:hypothetical protein